MAVRIVTWNLARKRPDRGRGAEAVDYLFGLDPDVMVLTETRTSFPRRGGHLLVCEPHWGQWFAAEERKVAIWSKHPLTAVDVAVGDGLDASRFVAATTATPIGPIDLMGVCIPWFQAEVVYHRGVKRSPWEMHVAYLEAFAPVLAGLDAPTVIAGDFNQKVPLARGGNRAAAAALVEAFEPVAIVTSGQLEGVTKQGIDHIAVSRDLRAERVWGWPHDVNGNRLSDHDGAAADVV